MNTKDRLTKCLNYSGCKIDLKLFESKCKALGEELITLRNQYNAAVLVNTKQADEIKDLQNRYAESSMLFQRDIKKLALALKEAADGYAEFTTNYPSKYLDLVNQHIRVNDNE